MVGTGDDTDRKRAEAALWGSEQKYRLLIENSHDIIYTLNLDGVFTFVSPSWTTLLGYSADQAVGRPFRQFVHPDDLAGCMAAMRHTTETGERQGGIEFRIRHIDGPWYWYASNAIALRDEAGAITGLQGTARDITERKRAETYRDMSIEVLRILEEPGPVRDVIERALTAVKARSGFDAVGIRLKDGEDFPYLAQDGFPKDFLLTENTLIERAADGAACRDGDGNALLECACGLAISGKADLSNPLFTKGGSFWTNDSFPLLELSPKQDPRRHPRNQCIYEGYASVALVPIRMKGRIVGLLQLNDRRRGCFSLAAIEQLENIAARVGEALTRKREEDALLESEAKFRELFDGAPVAYHELDKDGVVRRVNRAECALLGYEAGEMLGRPVWEFIAGSELKASRELFRRKLSGEQPLEFYERRYVRRDGGELWIEIHDALVADATGETIGIRSALLDITKRKRAEEALRESEENIRLLFDHSTSAIATHEIVLDAAGRPVDYVFLSANPAFEVQTGLRVADILGRRATEVLPGIEKTSFIEIYGKVALTGEAVSFEQYVKPLARHCIISAYRVGPGRFAVAFIDITKRKQAEEALRKAQEVLSGVLNSMPARVFWKDRNLVYLGCNEAFARDAGFERPADIIGKDDNALCWGEQAELYRGDDRAVIESGVARLYFEEVQATPAGEQIHLLTSKLPLRDAGGAIVGVMGTYLDNTKRWRAEEALRVSEARLRGIADSAQDAILMMDHSGAISYWNPAAESILGYRNEEAIGKSLHKLIAPERYLEAHLAAFPEFQRTGRGNAVGKTLELAARRKDGREIAIDLSLSAVCLSGEWCAVGILRDITGRKQAEEALRASNERSRMLARALQCVDDCISITDIEDRILYVNEAFRRTYGYRDDELIGRKIGMLRSERTSTKIQDEILPATVAGSWQGEIWNRTKGGRDFPISLATSVVYDEGGQTVALVGIARDITERKREEEELRAKEYSLSESQRIAHVGSWSWELATGLTVCAWSPETYRLFGVSPETFVPTLERFQSLIHPDDRAAMQAWTVACMAGDEPPDLEFRVCLSDGRIRHILGRGHLVLDAENKPVRMVGIAQDVTERVRAEEEVRRANAGLSTLVRQLEMKGAQETILAEMRTFLQACSSVRELAPVVAHSMRRLFPNSDGALFLLSPSGTDFETAVRWGDAGEEPDETVLSLESCWALRRGCLHVVADPKSGLICPHMRHLAATAYGCMPLTANGKVLGLLHLRSRAEAPPAEAHEMIAALEDISSMLFEMLSLSISNLQMSETLRMQSIRDPLTGLFNRRYMEETLEREIYRAARNKKQFSVVMVDIDHFKTVNDLHGHAAGDLVLTELAGLLRTQMRGGDIPCRYGGDELTLVLLESSLEDTVAWCNELMEKAKQLKLGYLGREIGPIELSLGVSVYPANGPRVEDLLHAADHALYRAKHEGRDRVVPASTL